MPFNDHLQRTVTSALASVPPIEAADIYAISFYLWNEDDDPQRPVLTLGYNTEAQVQQVLDSAHGRRYPDPAEARWNYAYWLQNELAVVGDSIQDPDGATQRDEWIKGASTADEHLWVTARFVEACTQLARHLHESGQIKQAIGQPAPVLVHELEYYEQIAQQTEVANPPGLAADFLAWVREQ
ncbi:hypothetical protein [Actinoallomurus sp. NPDC050550]|uniref:hypothetical protein n=1 Tax=Actinoallomurus sp. NPDC050550 TaxID=3154937 RepID=UPI003402B16D